MSRSEQRETILGLFTALRAAGMTLGVPELLDALRAVDAGWADGGAGELRALAELLFCDSRTDMPRFEAAWEAAAGAGAAQPGKPADGERTGGGEQRPRHEPLAAPEDTTVERPAAPQPAAPAVEALPLRAPAPPPESADPPGMQPYFPVGPRAMAYAWRFLRRPVADGPADVLDVAATVAESARRGFFLAPVMRRRSRNAAHLLLLVDRGGSMVPFHRIGRDLVETARLESDIGAVDVFYFGNVPGETLFADERLTARVALERVLATCDADTAALVLSDAGAARGYRSMDRVRRTGAFLSWLRRHTALLAWLNPMPRRRWRGSSAEIIAALAPMFALDEDGLAAAVDVVRGQPIRHV